jgi:predicted AlkP superfamily pyrophosphatase or phosphodiesterase
MVLSMTKKMVLSNQAITFVNSPRNPEKLLVFIVAGYHHIGIEKYIRIMSNNKLMKIYLKDIVYHGAFYFV